MSPAHSRKRFQHAAGPRLPQLAVVPQIDPVVSARLNSIARGVTASVVVGGVTAVSWAVAPANAAPAAKAQSAAVVQAYPAVVEAQQLSNGASAPGNITAGPKLGRTAPSVQPAAVVAPAPAAAATPQPSASTPAPAPASNPTPPPIAGLTDGEMANAAAIVQAGKQLNLPSQAFVVAIATALQESHLRNLANPNVPGSTNHPNEGVGYDYDSVGLFQQRPSWGTVDQLMDPQESARRFYAALVQVDGWQQMAVTVAAQTVQGSAFPNAYAQWQILAEQIVAAIG